MIHFQCPSCGKGIKVGDLAAGKDGKCPACGAAVHVPEAMATASPVPPPLKREERAAVTPDDVPHAAATSDEDAFAAMGGAGIPAPIARPSYSPPTVPKGDQPLISDASQQTLQRAAEHAAAKRSHSADTSDKYLFLSLLVSLYRIAAGLALLIGAGAVCDGLAEQSGVALGLGGSCIGTAVTAILAAEVVSLFLDMERNQRKTNELLTGVLASLVSRDGSSDNGN